MDSLSVLLRAWSCAPPPGSHMTALLYCAACCRVNMKSVEVTIQNLIGSGLDPQLENNPYLCFVYTSFQVRSGCTLLPGKPTRV